jgi:RNA polymerase sigma factor (sigma-70 family)
MKIQDEALLQLLRNYRAAHMMEKTQLMMIPAVRQELRERLQNYDQTGRTRRISEEKLDVVMAHLDNLNSHPGDFLPILEDFRFPLEFWNHLRQFAETLPDLQTVAWQQAQQSACGQRNEILEHTAYLVNKVRRINFTIDGQRIDDADGNGFLGLLKAIDNFTEAEGRSFESYARIYILNQIVCFLRNDKLVKPSDGLRRFYIRHDAIVQDLRQTLRREPTPQEIATALDIDVDELADRQERRGAAISLDTETGEEDEFTLHDLLGQEAALPYERMENHLIVDRLDRAMRGLSQTEASIVNLRWPPFQECELIGPMHRAPAAYKKMQQWSLSRVLRALP